MDGPGRLFDLSGKVALVTGGGTGIGYSQHAGMVVVADGSKIGQVSLVHLSAIDEVDLLVTDGSAEAGALAAIEARGVAVEIAV